LGGLLPRTATNLPPFSQYDAAARPTFDSVTDKAELAPYTHGPPRIDINELNAVTAYGADRSLKMNVEYWPLRVNRDVAGEREWIAPRFGGMGALLLVRDLSRGQRTAADPPY
jgi:hypothetical protein